MTAAFVTWANSLIEERFADGRAHGVTWVSELDGSAHLYIDGCLALTEVCAQREPQWSWGSAFIALLTSVAFFAAGLLLTRTP